MCIDIMASPIDKKGQCRESCGHIMASFDKLISEDNCVLDKPCSICGNFTESQKDTLATPAYRIRKDKKASLLVSPKDVTVLATVDDEPTFQSPVGLSVQISAEASVSSATSQASSNFVTSDQFMAMSDKWAEPLRVYKLSLQEVTFFSTPVSSVKPVASHQLISDTPFMAQST